LVIVLIALPPRNVLTKNMILRCGEAECCTANDRYDDSVPCSTVNEVMDDIVEINEPTYGMQQPGSIPLKCRGRLTDPARYSNFNDDGKLPFIDTENNRRPSWIGFRKVCMF
jgi:hypothetical protein